MSSENVRELYYRTLRSN